MAGSELDDAPEDEVVNSSFLEKRVCDRKDLDNKNTCSNSSSSVDRRDIVNQNTCCRNLSSSKSMVNSEQSINALDTPEDEVVDSSSLEKRVCDRRDIDNKNTWSESTANKNTCCSDSSSSESTVKSEESIDVLTEVRETVSELFPRLYLSGSEGARNEFELLVKTVARYVGKKFYAIKREKIAPTASDTKNVIRAIIKGIIHDNYPNRAFFQLLNRWARKHKQDFSLDSFNTLVVLACNLEQSNCNLSHLLLNSRDFIILPPGKTRQKIMVKYAAPEKGKHVDPLDNAVDRIDLTIRLLYSGSHSTHDIYFSRVRMNSVKTKHDLTLPKAIFLPPDLDNTGSKSKSLDLLANSKNVEFDLLGNSKNVDFNPNKISQSQTRASKSKSLDSLATICAPKRPLQNSPDNNNMTKTKKRCTTNDSSTNSMEKSQNSMEISPKTSVQPQIKPAYSFNTSPLLGYHMPQSFKNVFGGT